MLGEEAERQLMMTSPRKLFKAFVGVVTWQGSLFQCEVEGFSLCVSESLEIGIHYESREMVLQHQTFPSLTLRSCLSEHFIPVFNFYLLKPFSITHLYYPGRCCLSENYVD